ncbi:MAG: fumarate hydratase [Chloroflexi bacterium]|nr:fumarate hydratase [Chloroflexota bacterium]
MREIEVSVIIEAVAQLCQEANFELGKDVVAALKKAEQVEESPLGKETLKRLLENAQIAKKELLPLCQDCGTAVVFMEVGQDVHIVGGNLDKAIEEGVRQGYTGGYLRKSMVKQPFSARVNTNDNTPPIIHTEIVPGDRLKIILMCKGGGAENMSRLGMLKPVEGRQGVIDFAIKTVEEAGGKACPPLVVGVGIGGTTDMVMLLAKKALLRKVGESNPDPEIAELEKEIFNHVNNLGIGPSGFGGRVTALAVHAEVLPSHTASLPVAVNLQCHSARHKEIVL